MKNEFAIAHSFRQVKGKEKGRSGKDEEESSNGHGNDPAFVLKKAIVLSTSRESFQRANRKSAHGE